MEKQPNQENIVSLKFLYSKYLDIGYQKVLISDNPATIAKAFNEKTPQVIDHVQSSKGKKLQPELLYAWTNNTEICAYKPSIKDHFLPLDEFHELVRQYRAKYPTYEDLLHDLENNQCT